MTLALMEISPEQLALVEHCLPKQRGNVSMAHLQVVNAMLYVAEQGCKWRGLPQRFGNWHTIYTRMRRWAKAACGAGPRRGPAALVDFKFRSRGSQRKTACARYSKKSGEKPRDFSVWRG